MTFEHPLWLWLIAPAVALAILDAFRRWPTTRWRRVAAIGVRVIVIAALAAAAADPRWTHDQRAATVVFLIDRSGSVGDDALAKSWARATTMRAQLGGDERAAVVHFDGEAKVAIAPGDAWAMPKPLRAEGAAKDATDLAAAVRLGLGLIPPDEAGHLVVISDGRANAGDLAAATAIAKARKVPISVIGTDAEPDDPAIGAIALDASRIRPGASVTGRVDVDAGGVTGSGTVTVKVGGVVATTAPVQLAGVPTNVPFTYSLGANLEPGVISVDATLTLAPGTTNREPANDHATTPLVVDKPPKILILDGDENGAAPLAAALKAEKMEVTIVPANTDKPLEQSLAEQDLVILTNAPARGGMRSGVLDDELGEKLVKWVNDGGGLLVLGGPSALDSNYAANRIADALPVEIEPMDPELDAAATVIVILDQSGSMGAYVAGKTKLGLAAEGAAAVIRLLRSFDKIGVMAVEDRVHWVVPVRSIENDTAALEAKVRHVPVGGDGIFVYTSLVEAKKTLEEVKTPLRHVILFSDTYDAAEQVSGIDYGNFHGWPSNADNSFDVARKIKASGATLSVIGVGDGADNAFHKSSYMDDEDDSDFLRQLAAEGGGRYYRTSDAKQLRALFVQDARRLLDSEAREEDIRLKAVAHHAALEGVELGKAPKLHGYQEVKPRPAAQVVIVDEDEHPILTRWPYGLGEVAVWASDAGPRWADDWVSWPGYARFWTQMVRSALRRREGDATAVEVDFAGNAATVRVVDRREQGEAPSELSARVVDPWGTRPLTMRIVEPGVREAVIDVKPGEHPTVEVLEGKDVVARQVVVKPPSTELRQRGPDEAALAQIAQATGGEVSPDTVVARGGTTSSTSTPLAPWLILLALLMLPIDAMVRRVARMAPPVRA